MFPPGCVRPVDATGEAAPEALIPWWDELEPGICAFGPWAGTLLSLACICWPSLGKLPPGLGNSRPVEQSNQQRGCTFQQSVRVPPL